MLFYLASISCCTLHIQLVLWYDFVFPFGIMLCSLHMHHDQICLQFYRLPIAVDASIQVVVLIGSCLHCQAEKMLQFAIILAPSFVSSMSYCTT
jgi:hypothetical protein